MNRALLAELQRQRLYPSVTVLLNTTPGVLLGDAERAAADRLVDHAARRLDGDVPAAVRDELVRSLRHLLDERADEPCAAALVLCASPAYAAAVDLGRQVDERVVVDDTFATRDLVADLNRTARFRILTLSDRAVRSLVGDRRRVVEERDDRWPLERDDEQSDADWQRAVTERIRSAQLEDPLPVVLAGVGRSIRRRVGTVDERDTIGVVPGNHDRTGTVDLHHLAWPLVSDWLRAHRAGALARLDDARSARRYAGGIHEVWPLARDGRVELVVVDEAFRFPARVDANGQLHPAEDAEAPDVVDDVVDETIEAVLRHDGAAVIVGPGMLADRDHIAAVLRY